MAIRSTWLGVFAAAMLVVTAACDDDAAERPRDAPVPVDAGAPDASCFESPRTYNEIINACTTAVKVYKDSRPPLLRADGTVPPLP